MAFSPYISCVSTWCNFLADCVKTQMSERQSGNAGRFSRLIVDSTLAEAQKLNCGEPFFDIFRVFTLSARISRHNFTIELEGGFEKNLFLLAAKKTSRPRHIAPQSSLQQPLGHSGVHRCGTIAGPVACH